MSAAQRESCSCVIESCSWPPACLCVASRAIRAQLSIVLIRMARTAFTRETQESAIQVLDDDRATLIRGYVLGVMALIACQPSMTAHQGIASLGVIERLYVRLPMNQIEIDSVVIGMA